MPGLWGDCIPCHSHPLVMLGTLVLRWTSSLSSIEISPTSNNLLIRLICFFNYVLSTHWDGIFVLILMASWHHFMIVNFVWFYAAKFYRIHLLIVVLSSVVICFNECTKQLYTGNMTSVLFLIVLFFVLVLFWSVDLYYKGSLTGLTRFSSCKSVLIHSKCRLFFINYTFSFICDMLQ